MTHAAHPPCWRSSHWGRLALATIVLVSTGALLGCDDPYCEFSDVDVPGRDTNPDGVAYPTDRLGAAPLDHFPNFTFQGYLDGNTAAGLQTISLADFHDPNADRHRVLHLVAAAMWCPVCGSETDQLAAVVPALREEGAVFVQAVIDGPSRDEAPDRCHLDDWIEEHGVNFTVVFDVDARRIGSVTALTGVPWNALIDTRTMEVLDAGIGAPADLAAYVRWGLDQTQ